MKATKQSAKPKRSNHSSYRPAGTQPVETAVFATLGLVALAAVVVAVVWGSVAAGSKEEPPAALERYLHSGQLAADARTLAAMVRYVLESERPMVTNVGEPNPTQKNLAMPTNNATREPKA